MQTGTIDDLRAGVAEYMGTTSMPLGNQTAYDKSIKAGIDYCWRYAQWRFSIRRNVALTAGTGGNAGKYYLPTDFDILGWRDLGVTEYDTQDGDSYQTNRGLAPDGVYLLYDASQSRWQVVNGTAEMRVAYQVKPPELNEVISFPSLDPLYMAGGIFQKQKDMPNSANVTQPWDILHQRLDQLSGAAYQNTPKHRPRNRYEQYSTHTGDTR